MAFLTCSTASNALGKCIQYNVVIPEKHDENTPNVLLLHGLSDDHTVWQRLTSIERYANERGICVIMPDGGRSFYTDMKYGGAYYTCIVNDVLESAHNLFNISTKREKNFTAGLSMGGYGAVKIALRNPDRFAGCASLSGALKITTQANSKIWNVDFSAIWGEDFTETIPGSQDDLIALIDTFDGSDKPKPKIFAACGDEDFLLDDNRFFRDYISGKGFDFTYEEHPGNHNWLFWDTYIQRAIDVLLGK